MGHGIEGGVDELVADAHHLVLLDQDLVFALNHHPHLVLTVERREHYHVREAVLHELGLACRESLVLDAVEQLLLVREALAGPDGLELESKHHVGTPVHARSSGAHGAAPVGRSVQAHPTNVPIPKYELRSIAAGDRACSGRFPATPLDAPRIPAHAARPAARGGCARRTFDRYG